MKENIITTDITVTLSIGRKLTTNETIAIKTIENIKDVDHVSGEIKICTPDNKINSVDIDLIKQRINRAIQIAPYREATEEEGKELLAEAEEWYANAPKASNFHDCKSLTKKSVAEYIANQKGLTIFSLK